MRSRATMRTIAKSLALFLASLMLFACTDGGAGIFYSIEIEEPISNNDLPDFLTSQSAVRIGTDYYFAALQLYTGTAAQIAGGSDLSRVSLPDGWRYTMQIASDGTNLYAILENREGDSSAFYHNEGGSLDKSTSTFTGRPYKVWHENGNVYVATVQAENEEDKRYSYRLYGGADGNSLNPVNLPFTPSNPIMDIAHDSNEGETFVITSSDCFRGTGTTINTTEASAPSNLFKRSLYFSSHETGTTGSAGGTLFMATSNAPLNGDGAVYYWDDVANTWTAFDSSVGKDPTDFADVQGKGGVDFLLLGTQSGYYEMSSLASQFSAQSESGTLDSDDQYERTELESAAVMGFLDVDSTNSFFALTATNGIWKNDDGEWSQE